jgi:hypothetical protein
VKYAPFGEAESWRLANGIRLGVGLDSSNRQDSISTMPDSVARIKYGLNPVGNFTGITNCIENYANQAFRYDECCPYAILGRLLHR